MGKALREIWQVQMNESLDLALALMEVSLAVESHGQPTVPFGFDPARFRVHF